MEQKFLLDVREAADLLRLKETTIRSWVLKRKIAYVKLGRRVFIRSVDVEALVNRVIAPLDSAGYA